MKNSSDIIGLSFADRLLGRLRSYSDILSYLGVGVLSFLLSDSVLFYQIAPFGVAICAAVRGDHTFAAVLGAVLGTLAAPALPFKMKYIAAILIVGAVKWALSGKGRLQRSRVISALLSGLAIGITGMAVSFVGGVPQTYQLVLCLSEVLLAGGSTYFFARTLSVLDRQDAVPLRQSDLSCVVIAFGLLVVALCPLGVGEVSLGRIVAVLVVLTCALKAGEAGGSIGGVTAGVACALSDTAYAFMMGSFGFGGLMAGVFSSFGRFGCAAALVVVNGVATALAALVQPVTLAPVIEVFIASVIFVLLPQSLFQKLTLSASGLQTMSADSVKNIILGRLYHTKKAIGDVAVITQQVANRLQECLKPITDINAAAAERVCRSCPQRGDCWQQNFNDTSSALNDMQSRLRQGKLLTLECLPEPLRTVCRDPQELLFALTSCYNEQRRQEAQYSKSAQLRSIVLDQWGGIERLISDISSEITRIAVQDEQTCLRVREYLSRRGIRTRSLSCYEDEGGHIVIELGLFPSLSKNLDKTELTFDFGEICDRDFDLPEVSERDDLLVLTFYERPGYKLSYGVSQISASGKKLCGDSFKYLEEHGGSSYAILSDGMGNGSLAAIDSSMATALISRLAEAGVGLEATLKLVNSAMLIKSGDESLATVDICSTDLYRGSVTLYKAGAAPSYLRKSGKVGYVESSSLPAGILNSVEFEKTSLQLSAGDIIVLVSDGVTQTGEEWVLDELERFGSENMQALCERIATLAKLRRSEVHDDDITVFAMMLHEAA
ncbi:SpoIIE family protein phosphatase [Provencibacterium massiliense]|uniref:SpoIIE family protein phosphatase n=1 Tax=Provencibacterium massiliense TaxID=1841868 RepID=UPI0009A5F336|nr:SpoIIE family protein phosphatase [Provencibacterium massiliense]RGB67898.1 hypothetical protein DW086_05705 [Harryflintia acetispora]